MALRPSRHIRGWRITTGTTSENPGSRASCGTTRMKTCEGANQILWQSTRISSWTKHNANCEEKVAQVCRTIVRHLSHIPLFLLADHWQAPTPRKLAKIPTDPEQRRLVVRELVHLQMEKRAAHATSEEIAVGVANFLTAVNKPGAQSSPSVVSTGRSGVFWTLRRCERRFSPILQAFVPLQPLLSSAC